MSLAGLLWPDDDAVYANRSLRQALYLLGKTIRNHEQSVPFLLITRQTVQFNRAAPAEVDVLAFLDALNSDQFDRADSLYCGDLLAGVESGSHAYDEWLTTEREYFRRQALHGAEQLGTIATREQNPQGMIAAARRQLALAPWHEAAHRLLMQGLVARGDRNGALEHYDRFCRELDDELGVGPTPATKAIAHAIRVGDPIGFDQNPISVDAPRPVDDLRVTQGSRPLPDAPQALEWIVADQGESALSPAADHPVGGVRPPTERTYPPETSSFVGRSRELAAYHAQLRSFGCALIHGMPGVGKTALAAVLAQSAIDDPARLFWHSFNSGESAEAVYWKLAAFLASHGHAELWTLMQQNQQTNGQPPPVDLLVDYVAQALRTGRYLICFDDYQHVGDDSSLHRLVTRFIGEHATEDVGFILTTRQLPRFAKSTSMPPLAGLAVKDARMIVARSNVAISHTDVDTLHQQTDGNAMFLTLAVEAIAAGAKPETLMQHSLVTGELELYLLDVIYDALSADERAVMEALSVLLNYPSSRELIDEMLGQNSYRRLRALVARHLVFERNSGEGRVYLQHSIVQSFYYHQMTGRHRRELHGRAAEAYAASGDSLRAALHWQKAERYAEAADELLRAPWALVNAGELEMLTWQLEESAQRLTGTSRAVHLQLTLGELSAFNGEPAKAQEWYEAALKGLHDDPTLAGDRVLAARAYHGLGSAQLQQAPQTAAEWLERALEEIGDLDASVKARALIDLGRAIVLIGNYADAGDRLQAGVALCPPAQRRLRLTGLAELASVYLWTGRADQSAVVLGEALELARSLGDRIGEQTLLLNQGILLHQLIDLPSALSCLEGALASARQLGNSHIEMIASVTLGVVHSRLGEFSRAEEYYDVADAVARDAHHAVGGIMVLNNRGMSAVGRGDYLRALDYTAAAMAEAEQLGVERSKAYVLDTMALAYAGLGRVDEGLESIQRAMALIEHVGDHQADAFATRTYAELLALSGEASQAIPLLQRHIVLSETVDRYDAARGKLLLGKILIEQNSRMDGCVWIRAAHATFVAMKVPHWAAECERLLADAGCDNVAADDG